MDKSIVQELQEEGLLSEAIYENPMNLDKDGDGKPDAIPYDQAKIDPSAPQITDPDKDIQNNEADKKDEPKQDDKKEEEEPKEAEPAVEDEVDPDQLGGLLGKLQSCLAIGTHFVEMLDALKDQVAAKYGEENVPAYNEVIHKIQTAHDMLADILKPKAAEPEPAPVEEPKKDEPAPEGV